MRKRTIIILAAVGLVVIVGGVGIYQAMSGGNTAGGEQTATVQRGDISVIISAYGNIQMSNREELSFGSGGTVEEVNVEVGDYVAEGDVLARLDTIDLELAVYQAEISLWSAKTSLYTIRQIPGHYYLDEKALENAVTIAEINLEQAEEALEKATIAAPFDGQVIYVGAEAGDELGSGGSDFSLPSGFSGFDLEGLTGGSSSDSETMIIIVDPNQAEMTTTIDELDVLYIEKGQSAVITIDALTGMEFTGTVTEVALIPVEQEWVVSYSVTIGIDTVPDLELREGLSAVADIFIGHAENVLMVPNRALSTSAGNTVVQVVTDEDTVERIVQTGLSDGQYTEITFGLSEGEKVLVR